VSKINPEIGTRPELRWVDVTLIDVDHNYQREIDGKAVQRILADFRWDHFGAVVLASKADGRFAVTDGQHRVKAAQLHPAVSEVPALVTSLAGTEAEAQNFLVINRSRKAVTTVETFWAGVTAGDPGCLRVHKVLQAAGCDVVAGPGDYKPGHTNAVTAVTRALERYGDAAVIAALKAIRAAWPADAQALRGTLITALARLFRNNAEIDAARLVRVLQPKSYAEMTAAAEAFRRLSGGDAPTAISKTIAELYNKHLQSGHIYFGAAA